MCLDFVQKKRSMHVGDLHYKTKTRKQCHTVNSKNETVFTFPHQFVRKLLKVQKQ